MAIGWIGTGLMGCPMAERVVSNGFRLVAYNRSPEKLEPLRAKGATIVADPAAVLLQSECVGLMLTDAQAIRETILSPDALVSLPGKTILQMSTISPEESRSIQSAVVAAGGSYLEAPVLGSIPEAKIGMLIVMVGAELDQFQRWEPLLLCFGRNPKLVGPVGSAAAMKLALNQLIGSLTTAFAMSLAYLQQQEIAVEPFMDILRGSALYAPTFDKKLPRLSDRHYDHPNFPTKHLLKDIRLFQTAAASLGLATDSVDVIEAILERAIAQGFADADYSALYEAIAPARAD